MRTRRLANGHAVAVHTNAGLRKRCDCPRRTWPKCPHPWHFNFTWRGTHHRFPLDQYARTHIVTKDAARAEADRLRALIRAGAFPPAGVTGPVTPADYTFEQLGCLWIARARTGRSRGTATIRVG